MPQTYGRKGMGDPPNQTVLSGSDRKILKLDQTTAKRRTSQKGKRNVSEGQKGVEDPPNQRLNVPSGSDRKASNQRSKLQPKTPPIWENTKGVGDPPNPSRSSHSSHSSSSGGGGSSNTSSSSSSSSRNSSSNNNSSSSRRRRRCSRSRSPCLLLLFAGVAAAGVAAAAAWWSCKQEYLISWRAPPCCRPGSVDKLNLEVANVWK